MTSSSTHKLSTSGIWLADYVVRTPQSPPILMVESTFLKFVHMRLKLIVGTPDTCSSSSSRSSHKCCNSVKDSWFPPYLLQSPWNDPAPTLFLQVIADRNAQTCVLLVCIPWPVIQLSTTWNERIFLIYSNCVTCGANAMCCFAFAMHACFACGWERIRSHDLSWASFQLSEYPFELT